MRRLLLALLVATAVPSAAAAQPRLLVGGGFTAPNGQISDLADPGFHLQVGLQVRLPTLPISMRGDGAYHRLGAKSSDQVQPEILSGVGSLVFHLPGVGLQPYFLAGIGSYRTETGPVDASVTTTDTGYHGGFGVAVGGTSFGAFAEIRYVQIQSDQSARLIPLTLGLRF